MDFEQLPETAPDKFKNIAVLVFLVGILTVAVGVGLFLFKSQPGEDIKIVGSQVIDAVGEIVVHVDGAVLTPGVYKLSSDARVNDAILASGGFKSDAASESVNLASKITDGQKIYVPKIGETKGTSTSTTSSNESVSGLVNINSASTSELEKLPAIGPVTADKIIASRPYSSIDELLSKKVVGSSTYEKIKDLVAVY